MAPDEPSFAAIEASFKKAAAALRDAEVPFLLGGSLASWARGGPETRNDLDLVLRREDADRALGVLAEAGMRTERPPEGWLYKAWDGDVLIDLIFGPRGLEVTDEVIERGDHREVLGIGVRLMAIEDVVSTKLQAIDEHCIDYSSLVGIARALREQIDWDAVRERTRGSPYARAFFVLIEELGIVSDEVPARAGAARVRVVPPRDG